MSGVIGKDCDAACPAGTTPTDEFDKIGHVCPPRNHEIERLAIAKHLGIDTTDDDDIPTLEELGLRPVEVIVITR